MFYFCIKFHTCRGFGRPLPGPSPVEVVRAPAEGQRSIPLRRGAAALGGGGPFFKIFERGSSLPARGSCGGAAVDPPAEGGGRTGRGGGGPFSKFFNELPCP